MKIQKSSLHYRLLGFFDMSAPDNLCAYFWAVVFTAARGAIIFFMAIPAVICLLLSPWIALILYFFIGPSFGSGIFFVGVLGGVAYACLGIIGLCYVIRKTYGLVVPQDSVVVEYIKAKHRKICPLLDFE